MFACRSGRRRTFSEVQKTLKEVFGVEEEVSKLSLWVVVVTVGGGKVFLLVEKVFSFPTLSSLLGWSLERIEVEWGFLVVVVGLLRR